MNITCNEVGIGSVSFLRAENLYVCLCACMCGNLRLNASVFARTGIHISVLFVKVRLFIECVRGC